MFSIQPISLRWLLRFIAALVLFANLAPRASALVSLTSEEAEIVDLMMNSPGQRRAGIQLDPILTRVARERAVDMAARNYFDHINPDGNGPNFLVKQAGYTLPASWSTSRTANNIESISAGYGTAAEAWQAWMQSAPHKTHLLALDDFYVNQTSCGVGVVHDARSTYKVYWVVITAPPMAAKNGAEQLDGAHFISQSVPGTLNPGDRVEVTITFQNIGTTTWSEAAQVRLASESPEDNRTWGLDRVFLAAPVASGGEVIFRFTIVAPSTAGTYDFQWRLLREGADSFGEFTPRIRVTVGVPAPPAPQYSAASYRPADSSSGDSKGKKSKKKKKKKK